MSSFLHRMFLARLLWAAAACAVGAAGTFDPYVAGRHNVSHTWVDPLLRPDLPMSLSVSAPTSEQIFPVVVFISGLEGMTPAAAQSRLLQRIASHGLVVVTAWSLTESGGPAQRAVKLEQVMDWMHSRLPDYLHHHHFPGLKVDFNRTTMLAHSAGAHVVVSYLERQCDADTNVKGLALMSPVDGVDPFGFIKEYCITPGQKVNFTLPTLVLTAGLDTEHGFPMFPPCAPTKLSNGRFYDAFSSPRWQINATQFGHVDFFQDAFWMIVKDTKFCAVCAADDCDDRPLYQDYMAGQIVSFALATTDPDSYCDQLMYLEDFSLHPVATVGRNDRAADVCRGFLAGCARP
ncbi:chlorophyllase-2-like [Pollicipes pollicipes]|uniref:chlorophyllase-2-like n=1 Tax=Pollicipes pollicipes TaxID=41117 RepID=UPI001885572C|nr:chlorophyllase-2-like [Pollicipes pollicipes]